MAPSKVYNHYITAHGCKRCPGNFYWALFFHVVFTDCGGSFTGWAHGRM